MSIKYKIPLMVLGIFLFNILFIGAYYRFSLSKNISINHDKNIAYLEKTARELTQAAKTQYDYKEYLAKSAKEKGLVLQMKDRAGNVLYSTGKTFHANMNLSTQDVFVQNGNIYLLKVIWPIPLRVNPAFRIIDDLFWGEIVIISVSLLILMYAMHRRIVSPIVELQKIMLQYKKGKKPIIENRYDEIGILQQVYSELIDLLEADKQLQYRIIASISHDIKTPLTSVMGYAERLQKGTVSAERFTKYIQTIYSKSKMIKELVDEFDDYVGVELQSGFKMQEMKVLQFRDLLEQEYYEELSFLEVDFQVICSCPDSKIMVDLTKLYRVFGNIISNSLKYKQKEQLKITIDIFKEYEKIVFLIADNGSGVEEEDIMKIFEPFYTSDQSRRVAGLGLSICKSLVDRHGGSIRAYNNTVGGLSIRIELNEKL
ncbi:HAMP domain-containing sensor histidine kinase [Anaerocolumna sp. AGMB13025]|uniref:sensor histidine kinase n=1 Tax=Anaerocolumna sp. AGMB13025 TaxID=3039116 RepID=UPI00241C4FED|nr:HAMP domain-containing sensor histidine kinase [Anaerocolumna sp. AGMB13025]WFR58394.1 HAMP domain-containing sensor histidine kinase [Anaerocolumna sp. AGMB13025]